MAFPTRQRAACVHEQKKSGPGKSSCQGGRPVNPGKPSCGVQTKLRPPWSGGLHGTLSLESTTSCLGQNVRFSHALATKKFRACAKAHVFPKGDVPVTPVSGMILSHCDIRTIHAPAILLTPMTAGMMALHPPGLTAHRHLPISFNQGNTSRIPTALTNPGTRKSRPFNLPVA